MKKRLNVDLIQSELRGGSAFFPGYKGGASAPAASDGTATPQEIALSDSPPPKTPEPETNKPLVPESEKVNESSNTSQGVPPPVPRTVPRTAPRPDNLIRKIKRPMRQRQPFDIYEDQYISLKQIADSERSFINGRGMSQMVREAIDAYLAKTAPSKKK